MLGCSSKEAKPFDTYTLFDSTDTKQSLHVDKILKITKIKSPKYTQSEKIWYKESSVKIDSYFYSRWNGSFNDIIEQNLLNIISKSGLYESVFVRHSKVRADLILESEIIEAIQSIEDNSVSFGIRLYLIEQRNSKLVTSKEFSYVEKSEILDAKGAVMAYEKIIKKLNKDVILWLSKSVKED
jgi:ABC-type uncharacterized transport system auxiliary subunit